MVLFGMEPVSTKIKSSFMRNNSLSFIKNIKITPNYSWFLNNIITNIFGYLLRQMTELRVEVMTCGSDSVVVPPLSASSTIITVLSNNGWYYESVPIHKLAHELRLQNITFIHRDDAARLKSFYVKKVLNANTVSKVLYLASLGGYARIKNKEDFFAELKKDLIIKDTKTVDKHLLLNHQILDYLPNACDVIDYKTFLETINATAISVNSSNKMNKQEAFTDKEDKLLTNLVNENFLKRKLNVNIVVISSRKSGSSYLYNYFKENFVNIPDRIKELNYFSHNFDKGVSWYKSQFTKENDASVYIDVCPTYGNDIIALERIKRYCENCKLVILHRDPMARSISHVRHILSNERVNGIDEVLRKHPEVFDDSNYEKIYKNALDSGFSNDQVIWINFDQLVNFDDDFVTKLSNLTGRQMLPPSANLGKNKSFKIRYKIIYRTVRRMNHALNILGLKLEQNFQDKMKKLFQVKKASWDIDLSDYNDFFEKQRSFLKKIGEKSELP